MLRVIAVDTVLFVCLLGIAAGRAPLWLMNRAGLPISAATTVLGTPGLAVGS